MKLKPGTVIHFPRSEAQDTYGAADARVGGNDYWYVVNKHTLIGRKIGRVGAKGRNYFDEAMAEASRLNLAHDRLVERRTERLAAPAAEQATVLHGVRIQHAVTYLVAGRPYLSAKEAAQARFAEVSEASLASVASTIVDALSARDKDVYELMGVSRDDHGNLILFVEDAADLVKFLRRFYTEFAALASLPTVEQIVADLEAENHPL